MLLTLGRGLSPLARIHTDSHLQTLVPSCVYDLDITQTGSLNPAKTVWINNVKTPADGALQAKYNFDITGDAVLTGAAGNHAAYFAMAANAGFLLPMHTPFTQTMHRTGAGNQFSLFMAFRYDSRMATGANYHLAGTTANTSQIGFRLAVLASTNELYLAQRGDTRQRSVNSGFILENGVDYIIGVAYDVDTGSVTFWCNDEQKSDVIISDECLTQAAQAFRFCGASTVTGGGAFPHFYSCSLFNQKLSNLQAQRIISAYKNRHKRLYTL